jgi:serine/threonine-protein kinase HipA
MKMLDVIYKPRNMLLGRLLQQGHQIWFEYDQAFLATGLNLSPFKLKFKEGMQKSDAKFRHNLHGLFDDSLPDGWGLLLMDRELRQRGVSFPLSPLDRLAYIGESAMGALSYQPSADSANDDAMFNISDIAEHAIKLFEGEIETVLPAMARAGGSPGGARPKVLVGIHGKQIVSGEGDLPDGYEHWIIKFAARDQLKTAGRMEYAYYRMAVDAGLNMMESRLFHVGDNSFFGTKRFDRLGNQRVHMHTVANLIDANFREPALDYETLCKITLMLTKNHQDLLMMYRMMVFNVAIQNQDDHAKNFSFLMDDAGEWRLSPAYDLTQSILAVNEHTTSVLGKGKAISHPDMLKLAHAIGITTSEANEIIDKVNEVVNNTSIYMSD